MDGSPRHGITRVRRETRRREAIVEAVEALGPRMTRVRFRSEDLRDFDSAAADDHVKLFLEDGQGGFVARDYTPRMFNAAAGTLVIDFALHGEDDASCGPATRWATVARVGDRLSIGGPRGSMIVADDFDWYLLVGDETAVPAVSRRLEELRPGVPVFAVLLADGPDHRTPLPSRHGLVMKWCDRVLDRPAGTILCEAIDGLDRPSGDGFVWIGAEATVARAVKQHVVETLGHSRSWIKASGYWQAGAAGEHVKLGD